VRVALRRPRQIGQSFGVGLASDERVEDRAAADAHDVAHHVRHFEVGVLQRLLDPLRMSRQLAHELFARAREIAELLNGSRRYEAALNQSMRQQIRDPGRVVHVALAARNIASVHRIGQDQREVAFQHVPHGLPIHAGRFHPHVRAPVRCKPFAEFEQAGGGGWDGVVMVGHLTAHGDTGAGHDASSVNIKACTLRIQDLHNTPLVDRALAWSPRGRNLRCALSGYAGVAIRGARETPGPTNERAPSTIEMPTSVPAPPLL
jgi:hypothetical protein